MPEPLYAMTPGYKGRVDDLIKAHRIGGESAPGLPLGVRELAKLDFKCSGACPAFGCMAIDSVTLDSDNYPTFNTSQPSATRRKYHLVNLAADAVADGSGYYLGTGTMLWDAGHVLYDSGTGTPAFGETWGPQAGSWALKEGNTGFYVFGGNATAGGWLPRTVAVQQLSPARWVCTCEAYSTAPGGAETLNLTWGTPQTDIGNLFSISGDTITALRSGTFSVEWHVVTGGTWPASTFQALTTVRLAVNAGTLGVSGHGSTPSQAVNTSYTWTHHDSRETTITAGDTIKCQVLFSAGNTGTGIHRGVVTFKEEL